MKKWKVQVWSWGCAFANMVLNPLFFGPHLSTHYVDETRSEHISVTVKLYSGVFTAPLQQERFYSPWKVIRIIPRGAWVRVKKANVGVLNAALKFCFGCFFQLQNRLQSRLQHKGKSMHHFLQPSRGEWGAGRGSSPGNLGAGVMRITVKP